MGTNEVFLLAILLVFAVPYLVWRLGRTEYFAPLVVVQIVTGIVLGPGIVGALYPDYHAFVFSEPVAMSLNGIAMWGVVCFVWLAGIELDVGNAWLHRRETGITAALAVCVPLLTGGAVALGMSAHAGWVGESALRWQFVLAVGMCCAVTALPILVLFLDKLSILREPLGQRILRYASLDDVAIWSVLAIILMDWDRVGRQTAYMAAFVAASFVFRRLLQRLPGQDRLPMGLIWLAACSFGAEWAGLHFMVGAFLSGVVLDRAWFDRHQLDAIRQTLLIFLMPVYFLSAGLRTGWQLGGMPVLLTAGTLLIASVLGKLSGLRLAQHILKWQPGEGALIGWLLQTKALIMIVFANVLLDKGLISATTFTALLLMAVASTMLTIPMAAPMLQRLQGIVGRSR
ncbi:MAG: cation:proton antiporter [Steroidobacteraceae bacterium]